MFRYFTIFLLFISTSLAAQDLPRADWPNDAESAAIPILQELNASDSPDEKLQKIDRALALLPQPTRFRGYVLCMRGANLAVLERRDEARNAFDQCRQLRPDDLAAVAAIAFDDVRLGRAVEAANALLRVMARQPRLLENFDPATADGVLRMLDYEGQTALAGDLATALVSAGIARDNQTAFSRYAVMAVRRALESGKTDAAIALLPQITDPTKGLDMLIDRRYAAIWPAIETWAGSDFAQQRAALLNGADAKFRESANAENRFNYANALQHTGSRDDAISLLREGLAVPIDSDDNWYQIQGAIRLAGLLAETGKQSEAIMLLKATLTKYGGKDRASVNIVPNLAQIQLVAGRAADALATLESHTPKPEAVESPAALGFFVALRGCALKRLDRTDEAQKALLETRERYSSVSGAMSIAYGCIASIDDQAHTWIAVVRRENERSAALVQIQAASYRASRGLPAATLEEKMLRDLAVRADVRDEMAKLGRPLPTGYLPALDGFNTAKASAPSKSVRPQLPGPTPAIPGTNAT